MIGWCGTALVLLSFLTIGIYPSGSPLLFLWMLWRWCLTLITSFMHKNGWCLVLWVCSAMEEVCIPAGWISLSCSLIGTTPFAVHLRKMYIHLRQQLKLYGKYTFISTSMKFMNANELSITLFAYVLTFNSINRWTIAPLDNQTEQIYFQSRVMVDH